MVWGFFLNLVSCCFVFGLALGFFGWFFFVFWFFGCFLFDCVCVCFCFILGGFLLFFGKQGIFIHKQCFLVYVSEGYSDIL